MITRRWSTRALGEFQPYDNDVIVFLPDDRLELRDE